MQRSIYLALLSGALLFACKNTPSNDDIFRAEIPEAPVIQPTTTFELLPPARSGIQFVPDIQEGFQYNFLLDPYEYNGGGVAVLDFDNDGLQDLFFTHRFNGCRLYRNTGQLHFEDVSEKSGVAKASGLKTGVTVVDINADGWPDLYVCRTWLTNVPDRRNLLFVNNHDGTFSEQAAAYGIDDPSPSQCANFFDFDRDGDLDLYVTNHPVDFHSMNNVDYQPAAAAPLARSQAPRDEFESDKLYRNTGKGKFEDISQQAGIHNRAFGLSATTADFNDDGWPDLLVANDFVMPDFLYINNGNGTFREEANRWFAHTANHSMGCDIADLNNDALPDICIPDMLGSTRRRQKELMNSMLLERSKMLDRQGYGVPQQMRNVLQMSVDGGRSTVDGGRWTVDGGRSTVDGGRSTSDGRAATGHGTADVSTPSTVHRLPSTVHRPPSTVYRPPSTVYRPPSTVYRPPSTVYREVGCLAGMEATEWSWAPLIADFDNDGWKDLFISAGVYRDLNDLDFFFYTADSISKTGGITASRFKDFEEFAGKMPSYPVHNFMYHNTGTLRLQDVSEAWGLGKKGFSNGAAYADLDNDGDLDLILNNSREPASIYENKAAQTNGQHWLQIKCSGSPLNPVGTGAKIWVHAGGQVFYQEMTPTRGFYSSVEPIFQVGLGKTAAVDRVDIEWPEGKSQTLNQPPVDRRLVLRIADAQPGRIPRPAPEAPLFEELGGRFVPDFTHRENDFEDFDLERLLLHRFSRSGPCLAVGDINGDGREDLFAGGAGGQADALFVQQADGAFVPSRQPALDADASHEDTGAVFFDADGDGDADLYVVSGSNEEAAGSEYYQDRFYTNDGKGNFSRQADALPRETVSGSVVRAFDADGDGDTDLFVGARVNPGHFPEIPPSLLLLNNGKGHFENAPAALWAGNTSVGMVTDVQVADLDGDRKPELLACGEWMPLRVWQFDGKQWTDQSAKFGLGNTGGFWNGMAISDLDGDGDLDIAAGNEGLNTRLHATPGAPLRLFALDFDLNQSLDPVVAMADSGRYYPLAQRLELATQMPGLIKSKFHRYHAYARAPIEEVLDVKKLHAAQQLTVETLASGWFENKNGQFVFHVFPLEAQVSCAKRIVVQDFTHDGHPDVLLLGNDANNAPETGPYDASFGILLAGDGHGGWQFVPNGRHGLWAGGEVRDAVTLSRADGARLLVAGMNGGHLRGWAWKK